jgi:hypothetical protein
LRLQLFDESRKRVADFSPAVIRALGRVVFDDVGK